MAVEHMVWFQFKPGIPTERQQEHAQALRGMQGKIPGVLAIKVGFNFTDRAEGCELGLIVTLEDRGALEGYGPHPEHQKVAKPLSADCQRIMAMDFETH